MQPVAFLVMMLMAANVYAERLPLKSFSSADGLAHDHINQIYRDSHGFLWICTDEGLSRFDGYEFTNFTVADGLPHPHANGILEIPGKGYWIATDGGLAWFDTKRFTVYKPPGGRPSAEINSLARDAQGVLWLGTNSGLFRMEHDVIETVDPGYQVTSVRFDRSGSLWTATADGVYRRDGNGAVSRFLNDYINTTFQDSSGRLWILTRMDGFTILGNGKYSVKNGLPHNDVRSAYEVEPGRYWLASVGGLVEMIESPAGVQFRTYTTANGLSDNRVYKLESDNAGNLWIGTNHGGIQKLTRDGFISYDAQDGLPPSEFHAFSETQNGTVVLISGDNDRRTLYWFDGRRFHPVPLMPPQGERNFGFGWNQHAFEDREGRWWLPTLRGVYRYPRVGNLDQLMELRAKPFHVTRDAGCAITRLYEDSRGDVWMLTDHYFFMNSCQGQLLVWRQQTGAVEAFEPDGAWRKESLCGGWSVREDTWENLWVGLGCSSGLLRLRHGHVERFVEQDGVPGGAIHALLSDRQGRLWIGSSEGGLARVDDPAADKPRFIRYTTTVGLSSDQIWSLVEDSTGYIYASTGRGVDRIDPSRPPGPDSVRRFTSSDGFLKGEVRASYRDRTGTLWFASVQGVARLTPSPPREQLPTGVRITGLRVNGIDRTLEPVLNFGSDTRQLEIQFSGIDYSTDHRLLYEYKLDGADPEWSAPAPERSVTYANPRPGKYRFMVRSARSEPATLTFSIQAPLWERWWFRLAMVMLLALAGYAAHRVHLSRALAMQRLRMQIATDLHDDIGSSLSQIAVLSEVARLRVTAADELLTQAHSRIGELARELTDSMSDIVWAINPKHDHLADLVYRMRRFGDETVSGRNMHFEMAVEGSGTLPLHASQRRDVFLIFKESIHNAVRHSGCSRLTVAVGIDHKRLILRISDNGTGFAVDHSENVRGAGLESIRRRAARLSADLTITSEEGQGTSIHLLVPLGARDYINV